MPATAVDIPEELFDRILGILAWDMAISVFRSEAIAQGKRYMNRYSLVCRFWASRCRPWLFERLVLRSLEDAQFLLGLSPAIKYYVVSLSLEETEPCQPWTHIVYRAVAHDNFSPKILVSHSLDGACTPTSVQTLRSLQPSLPQRMPVMLQDQIRYHVKNYRLQTFTDIVLVVLKLSTSVIWQPHFTNISWIKPVGVVPPMLGRKNRALCDHMEIYQCVDRWPFTWLCITTRAPEPNNRQAVAYLPPDEAWTLGALVRCITSPTGHKGRSYCSHSAIYRQGPRRTNNHTSFELQISCAEEMNCTPYTHILCRDGRISQIRSWFLTDPEHGCMPFDFDWAEFDTLASRCHELAEVRMYLGPDRTYVAEFADGMTQRLRHVHGTGKLNIWYEGMEDEDEVWHTWKFNTHVDGDDA